MKSCLSKHIKMVAVILGSQGADSGFTAGKGIVEDWTGIEFDSTSNKVNFIPMSSKTPPPPPVGSEQNDEIVRSTSGATEYTENDPHSINRDSVEASSVEVPINELSLPILDTTNEKGPPANSNTPPVHNHEDVKLNRFWFKDYYH